MLPYKDARLQHIRRNTHLSLKFLDKNKYVMGIGEIKRAAMDRVWEGRGQAIAPPYTVRGI
jgi:hypothetical protein